MLDCKCGHYKMNHDFVRGSGYNGKCKGESGCYGHHKCKCVEFKLDLAKVK